MTDLPTLIARVERLEGPDREVDFDVWRIDGPDVQWDDHGCAVDFDGDAVAFVDPGQHSRNFYLASDYEDVVPRVTASLDAVVALAERVLPGWGWSVARSTELQPYGCMCAPDRTRPLIQARAPTPALALLLALLRAVQATKETT